MGIVTGQEEIQEVECPGGQEQRGCQGDLQQLSVKCDGKSGKGPVDLAMRRSMMHCFSYINTVNGYFFLSYTFIWVLNFLL